ncbi:LysR family transcriptional regulator [Kitasatospora sp. NBC_01266]|uniref:LysR family transcriptional regulator n=1 Tax=Kitasatospora sp. NBC_01266 TaxID=2903572 RepID=UPI002E365636|nr:LysR family transcriptional regulator [Kitasatospora sp. NBC_01266]
MELELRHLRALRAIADAASIGRAAAEMGCSQQALSTQLRRIESHFGEPLFERNTVGVRLTRYGAEVVTRARDVLARAEAIGRRPAEEGMPRPVLRLAATNSPILSGMVGRVRTELPELLLTVSSVYESSQIVELLESGELDAAIGVDYPGLELRHSEAVEHRGIVTEPSFVTLPADHRLKHRAEISLADLAEDSWFITPDDGAGWPGVFYAACEAVGFTPAVVHEFLGDRLQLQNMIAEGLGISLTQATTRPVPGVIVRPLIGTPIWCRYLLAWRKESIAEQVVTTLFGSAAASYRELIAQAPHFQAWAARTYHGTLP